MAADARVVGEEAVDACRDVPPDLGQGSGHVALIGRAAVLEVRRQEEVLRAEGPDVHQQARSVGVGHQARGRQELAIRAQRDAKRVSLSG